MKHRDLQPLAGASLLRERARRLAALVQDPGSDPRTLPVLVFGMGAEDLALPVAEVGGIAPFRGCTPVPGAPAALRGVVNLRGSIQPLFDLAVLMGLDPVAPAVATTVLYLRRQRGQALLVGDARLIERVDPATLSRSESDVDPDRCFLRGVCPGRFGLLDLESLLAAVAALET